MGPEHSLRPVGIGDVEPPTGPNEAIDAIVYDEHPALSHPAEYPYGRPRPNSANNVEPFNGFLESLAGGVQTVVNSLTSKPDYVVPKRFGMSAILGVMTALAGLFGILRFANAEPFYYAFFAIQSLAICLAQMFNAKSPRMASVFAGAVFLPLFTIVAASFSEHIPPGGAFCMAVGFIPIGALIGYLTGTCAAGVFLVMDRLETYLKGQPLLETSAHATAKPAP